MRQRGGGGLAVWVGGLLLAWAAAPLVWLGLHALRDGVSLTGSTGALAGADQLFYLDGIRQSGSHLLIADHFALHLGHAVFLHPLYLLAGALWRIGVPLQAAFWLLGIPAAAALAAGAVRLGRLALGDGRARALAAVLGLFYLSPVVAVLALGHLVGPLAHFQLDFPSGESMTAWQLWGYPHSALAVGLLALVLCEVVRMAEAGPAPGPASRRRRTVALAAAAALVGWLHPWQGAILIALVVAVAISQRSWPLARRLLVPVLAAGLPMLYEQILAHADAAWRLDSALNRGRIEPVWMLLPALLPLALPALPGIRRVAAGPRRLVLVGWPVAAAVLLFATDEFPDHALEGVALPLAVLAVAGAPAWVRGRRRALLSAAGVLAAAVAVACGIAYEVSTFHDSLGSGEAPYWLGHQDRAALAYLDRARGPGGVFADYYLGMAVPAFTGRPTWVGEFTWTPDFAARRAAADRVFAGTLPAAQARAVVALSGARFVLADCRTRADLVRLLGRLVAGETRFGCAGVLEIRRLR